MQTYLQQNTAIAAVATPAGAGAVGIVRLSGMGALQIAEKVFRPSHSKTPLCEMKGYTGCLGRVETAEGQIDEAVAFVYRAPHSYTGEDVVELCCHGNTLLLQRVLDALLQAGAQPAGPGEFTRRAFENGKLSLDQAESVMELINAQSESGARAALAARDGALWKTISACTEQLLDASAHLTAWVDYPEEGVEEVENGALLATLREVEGRLNRLLEGYDAGRILRQGVDTVIAGRPNVGKSTLMNLLAGARRSIVTAIPGTTRDVVEDSVRLGRLVLRLSDTAGLRATDDPVEQAGVEIARERLASCDLAFAMFDSSRPLEEEDLELAKLLKGRPCVAIINKTDLERRLDTAKLTESFGAVVEMSANTGKGVEDLTAAVEGLLLSESFDPAQPALVTARQKDCVRRAVNAIGEACGALEMGLTYDALSVCIDEATDALLELTGGRATIDVVDRVFEKFCVGK